jgi:hypothetical protein
VCEIEAPLLSRQALLKRNPPDPTRAHTYIVTHSLLGERDSM